MQLPPTEVIMTWPTPNYTSPHTRGSAVLIVSIICLILSTIITILRIYTRLRITCTAGLDDVLIVFGLVFAIAMGTVISMAEQQYGWNRHIWDVPLDWLTTVSKLNLTFQILFSLSCSITKLSLLWFCRRLLGAGIKGLSSKYNIAMILGMVVVGLSSTLFILISIFQCRPVRAYWDVQPQYSYHCLNNGAIVFSASVINIFTDVLVTILPMPLIWNLKLPTRQRIAVISIFGLGIVVDIAGSVRTVYVWKSMIASYDTTWVGWPVLLAATVEINLGLICASAPALRPLVAFFLPRLLGSSNWYGSNRQSRSVKQSWRLRSTTGASKQSRGSRHYGPHDEVPGERLEVFRTVEMKTYSESRTSHQPIGNAYDISGNPYSQKHTDESFLTNDSGIFHPSTSSERSLSPPSPSARELQPHRAKESV
ncbi:uncharacterized protein BJX67DRAFT_168976 [Aspergillus lucknowensis]|uniref:Rhodopsin domain-containing protein n=1 Tax=Aspergillus lucknowensis TaxID=176173 RepID=A0ABR4LMA0_9EURO